jgi:hypothetical protein
MAWVAAADKPLLFKKRECKRGCWLNKARQALIPFSPRALSLRLMVPRGCAASEVATEGGREGGRGEGEGRRKGKRA